MNGQRILFSVLALALLIVVAPPDEAAARSFTDVDDGAWFHEAVDVLSDQGVIRGFSDGSFGPYANVTRAQFAVMLARAVSPPAAGNEPFTDVPESAWYRDAVMRLHAAGLLKGTSATTFDPAKNISRQQVASFAIRAVGYARSAEGEAVGGFLLSPEQAEPWLGGFRDRIFITQAHRATVGSAVRLRMLEGYSDGRFYPIVTLTRAQAAGVLYRALYRELTSRPNPPQQVPAESSYPVTSVGARGPLVSMLESRLASMKYRPGPLDGLFDQRTAAAVMAFQKVNGLKRDGRAGQQVWSALAGASTPKLRGSGSGNWVEIDLTRQVLFLVRGGEVTKAMPISSGTTGWRTPTGHFHIQRKIPRWRESSLGLLYKPAYFIGGIAIHGSHSVPSYPASHGCVRVPMWEMDPLYPQLPIGLPVHVYY